MLRKIFNTGKPKFTYKQEALFFQALQELKIPIHGFRIDHPSASCVNNGKHYNLIFPLKLLKLVRDISDEKMYDYTFAGIENPDRQWVKKFEGENAFICFTKQGRLIAKDEFDIAYYEQMKRSRFTLCPKGDFNWSYRFFEAIICKSIPIVDINAVHENMKGFIYYSYTEPEKHFFDRHIVNSNYALFIQRHTLLGEFIDRF